jgi:hypothetical protein
MLTLPQTKSLPTFESFLTERQLDELSRVEVDPIILINQIDEAAPSQLRQVAPILDELRLEIEASRLDAQSRYSNPEEAFRCLYDWACRVLRRRMGREMDEVEQAYVREKCKLEE